MTHQDVNYDSRSALLALGGLEMFGYRERKMAEELLHEWNENGLPEGFDSDGVTIMMNQNSGYVFLTNSNYEVAMMNGDKLEIWYNCPECGYEGFKEDFEDTDCEGCREILKPTTDRAEMQG
jgi:hypothetical protein